MRIGSRLTLEARALDDDGRGLARAGDREVSVFDLLPGERARVTIEHLSPHGARAWGRIEARLGEPSSERIAPACPGFGRCGGCALQHLAYPGQLQHKRRRVEDGLRASLGPRAPEVAGTTAAPRVLGYRSRGKYVAVRERGALTLGAYEPRSHRVVETLGCRVVEPVVDRVARRCRDALADTALSVYDERRREGELRYVIVRSGRGGDALVGLVTTSGARADEVKRAAEAIAKSGDVAGVVWIKNDVETGALLSDDVTPIAGEATVREEIGPGLADLDIAAFSQVNREQARRLHRAAAELADLKGAGRAVELYCGAGAIALHLASAGAEVVGFERHEPAVAVARRAAAELGLSARARFDAADAAEAGSSVRDADAVVVDPPRKGLSPAALEAVCALRAPVIVYVSCNPRSFARDAAELVSRGYELDRIEPWDLMPGTPQVEILARFRRR